MGSFFDYGGGLKGFEGQIKRLREDPSPYIWPKQFARILAPRLSTRTVLVDVGCGVGYAYKDFKRFNLTYIGLDLEERLLEVAKTYFANDFMATFIQYDLMEGPLPVMGDIVISSDTFQYCPNLITPLGHLADAARDVLLLRVLLGETEIRHADAFLTPEGKLGWLPDNQYARDDVACLLHRKGFRVELIEDEYTGGRPIARGDCIRQFYIVLAKRRMRLE